MAGRGSAIDGTRPLGAVSNAQREGEGSQDDLAA